jgi:hypothetical protein
MAKRNGLARGKYNAAAGADDQSGFGPERFFFGHKATPLGDTQTGIHHPITREQGSRHVRAGEIGGIQ